VFVREEDLEIEGCMLVDEERPVVPEFDKERDGLRSSDGVRTVGLTVADVVGRADCSVLTEDDCSSERCQLNERDTECRLVVAMLLDALERVAVTTIVLSDFDRLGVWLQCTQHTTSKAFINSTSTVDISQMILSDHPNTWSDHFSMCVCVYVNSFVTFTTKR